MQNSLKKYQKVDRKLNKWFINVLLRFLLRFNKKRSKKLWIFGAWEGLKYSDNTKYLFEYINSNYKNIKCVWVTKNIDVYNELQKRNLQCVIIGTKECRKIELKAGVCFYTNGIDDFGNNPLIFGAKIISLGHGVSFKKVGFERSNRNNEIALLKMLKIIKYYGYFQNYADYFVTSSEYMKKRICKQFFRVKANNVFITGQPRNDIFALNQNINTENFILYTPTYRNNLISAEKLENILIALSKSVHLKQLLSKYNIKFYVKLHYLTPKINLDKESNINILSDRECDDIQKFLLKAKILITDYSSIVNDFALLKRPMILFPFDKEKYLIEEGISNDFEKILNDDTTAYDIDQLCNKLENLLCNPTLANKTIEIIDFYFNDNSLQAGQFAKNVYNAIYKEINYETGK